MPDQPPGAAAPVTSWHALTVEEVLAAQGVDAAAGLSSAEVTSRREKYGPNRFAEQKREPRWRAFLRQYADLMQVVLLVAGIVSIWPVGEPQTGVMLILLTVFNAYLSLAQEGKAAAAVAAL
ncbi:MAG: cation transport ATPase, partial [Chloroflexi bacterium]|nr:cation transport ATPase [Chloroflexota bacterium]